VRTHSLRGDVRRVPPEDGVQGNSKNHAISRRHGFGERGRWLVGKPGVKSMGTGVTRRHRLFCRRRILSRLRPLSILTKFRISNLAGTGGS